MAVNKDSAFPSRRWVSWGIAAGCQDVLCCHKDFTHRLDNLLNKSTCIYLSLFFFFTPPDIYVETHSCILMCAEFVMPSLLTWHSLFIISNPMLPLGGESSLCNTAHMVPCDDPCPCWGTNKKKLENHSAILIQRYTDILVIINRIDWLLGMFFSPLKNTYWFEWEMFFPS